MSRHVPFAFTVLMVIATSACAQQADPAKRETGVAVYVLSRGKGVPPEAQRVHTEARRLLQELRAQKKVLRLVDRAIGLEGERRICATFGDEASARAAHAKLVSLARGVDLVNVVIEPCTENPQGERQ